MGKELSIEDKEKLEREFKSYRTKAYSATDYKKVIDSEDKIRSLFSNHALRKFAGSIPLLFGMIKDSFSREYRVLPKGTIGAILFTLLYVINPFDIVVDIIPFVGYLDDATVLGICLKFVSFDLDNYKQWKELQKTAEHEK